MNYEPDQPAHYEHSAGSKKSSLGLMLGWSMDPHVNEKRAEADGK